MTVAVAIAAALAGIFFALFQPIEVVGDSMLPTYRSGRKGLAIRVPPWRKKLERFKIGRVYIYGAEERGVAVIKRLSNARLWLGAPQGFFMGDNPDRSKSRDSRDYGWVPLGRVQGRVLFVCGEGKKP
jgi:hypothetical protein